MKRIYLPVICVVLGLSVGAPAGAAEPGFVSLFDGKTLDGWNDLEITAKGMRIKSVLNGVTVVDYDGAGVLDDELHRKHNVGTKGVIGLQLHAHDELKLRFKDIRIRE